MIERPNHYGGENDLIDSWQDRYTDDEFRAIMKALTDRYVFRYDKKNGIEDLDKAIEVIRRLKEWENESN